MVIRMRRKISLFLILAILSSFHFQSVSAEEEYQREIDIIRGLGIISEVAESGFQTSAVITRAEFLVYIMESLGYQGGGGTPSFADVRPGHWAAGYVAQAEGLGIVSGYNGGYLRPDQEVLLGEAVKMLVSALGYGTIAEENGGYPVGYLAQAKQLGILDGVALQQDDALKKGVAVKLIYNASEVSVGVLDSVKYGTAEYTIQKKRGFLEMYRDIYSDQGILESNSRTGLSRAVGERERHVSIDGAQYQTGATDAEQYLGYCVKYYYHEDSDGEKTLLYIEPYRTSVWRIKPNEIEKLEDKTYTLYREKGMNKPWKYRISSETDVIYNGAAVSDYSDELLLPQEGSIQLIDNDNDGIYEVLFVDTYQVVVVKSYDKDSKTFADKLTHAQFDLNLYTDYTLQDSDGAAVTENALMENSVLFVMESLDKEYLRLIVSNQSINGQVTSIRKTSDGAEYVINDTVYPVSKTCLEKASVEPSEAAYFALDAEGTIQWIYGKYDSSVSYGYVMQGGKTSNGMDEYLALKVLSSDNQFLKLTTAPNGVELNGKKKVTVAEQFTALSENGRLAPQVIGYKLDSEGRICMIDTVGVITSPSDTLTLEYDTPLSHRYKSKGATVSGLIGVTNSTILFGVPSDATDMDETHYKACSMGTLPNDTIFAAGFKAYRTSAETPLTTILVAPDYASAGIAGEDPLAVISEIATGVTEEGEAIPILSVFCQGKMSEYPLESTKVAENITRFGGISLGKQELGIGDVIRFTVNAFGQISNIELHYDKSEEKMLGSNPTNGYTGAPGLMYMYVYKKVDDMIICSYTMPNGTMSSMTDQLLYFKATAYNIAVYDEELETKVKAGSINDIKDYETYGEVCSRAYIMTWYGEPSHMVVYK